METRYFIYIYVTKIFEFDNFVYIYIYRILNG